MSDEDQAIPGAPRWERVESGTYRLAVPGGWLYRYRFDHGVTMAFVPDPSAAHVSGARRINFGS